MPILEKTCPVCNDARDDSFKFCPECGTTLVIQSVPTKPELYLNPYGTWRVTTEGDCEGRSIVDLGIFTGFVDEIARALAKESYYSLRFSAASPKLPLSANFKGSVNVSFNIDSGTWNLANTKLADFAKNVFKDRPVQVDVGQYYASFVLKFD